MKTSSANGLFFDLVANYEKECEKAYVEMSDATQIQILRTFAQEDARNGFTLFVVPGWGSIVPGWDAFLMEAKNDFDIVYFESREKDSSIISKRSKVNFDRLSTDILETIEFLGLDQRSLILFGSCIGGNYIAHGLAEQKFDPFLTFLVGPQFKWPIPGIARIFIPFAPKWVLSPWKPFLRFWVRHFGTSSHEQAAKYIRVINEANSRKWHHVGKPIAFDKFWDIFPRIDQDVVVVGEGNDKMHTAADSRKIAELIPNAQLLVMESNEATHSALMVDQVRTLIKAKHAPSSEIVLL